MMTNYKLCVFGNNIAYSKSPWIHRQFAKQFSLSISYLKKDVEPTKFIKAVKQFVAAKGQGFNITQPFKEQAFVISESLSKRARLAKSVNTIKIDPFGQLYGDNTDGYGIITDLSLDLNYDLLQKTILIIGAGGAVRGIIQSLLSKFPKKILILNRTTAKTIALTKEFAGTVVSADFEKLKSSEVDVIIDGTSVNDSLLIPKSLSLSKYSLCYDLKYNSKDTPLIKWAREKNCALVTNGLGMLVNQAAAAFHLWTGYKPLTAPIIKLARENYSQ